MLFDHSLSLRRNTEPKCEQNLAWKPTLWRCIMGYLWIAAEKHLRCVWLAALRRYLTLSQCQIPYTETMRAACSGYLVGRILHVARRVVNKTRRV